ncbi:MAG: hypothetical protein KKB22_05435 [Candidatus Omnitrophica bacterium]|nr:hypothetical protein [Candidatus Omnitrophota bacterium]
MKSVEKSPKKAPVIGVIWKVVFNALQKHPSIAVPFFISGCIKLFGIAVIFFSIFYPLSIVFGPLIKSLYGEAFLHYPFNFSLMPKLFYYVQITVYIFLEGFLTSVAVWMAFRVNEGKKPSLRESAGKALPKYVAVMALLASIFFIVYLLNYAEAFAIKKFLIKFKFMEVLVKKNLLEFILICVNFLIVVLLESALAFAIPFIVLENKKFFKAIGSSFSLARRNFGSVFILILAPTLFVLPFTLLGAGLPILTNKTFPEITFIVLGGSVIVGFLADCMVTLSLTFLFLSKRDEGVEKYA